MKSLKFIIFCLIFSNVSAQVYKGQNLYGGRSAHSYFIFSNQTDKDLDFDLNKYLGGIGKVTSTAKNITRLEKIKDAEFSKEIAAIDVVFESNKKLQKLNFFFLDNDMNVLTPFQINDREAIEFVEGFQRATLKNLEAKLAQENTKLAELNLADAKKSQFKIEKSLESNLKEQEKLGKKLDASPEMLTKALSEKEEIVGALYSDSESESNKKEKGDLEKASTKKEKEIQKIQKDKEKAETKLSKKETEFDILKDNLFKAKALVKSFEFILKDANAVLEGLK